MATSGYFIKHPDALASYVFDFEGDIPENDTLGDYTLTINDSDGVDVTGDMLTGASINTSDITALFTGGRDGANYRITVIITLGTSTVMPVKIVEMRVRSTEV